MTSIMTGSSPHVRGALLRFVLLVFRVGIIPACAGSTGLQKPSFAFGRDHPRMCGEHGAPELLATGYQGSSPHVRGALVPGRHVRVHVGIIPACAGSTPPTPLTRSYCRDHPRMCGEHCTRVSMPVRYVGSSPHVRGALPLAHQLPVHVGIIPACAGSTSRTGRSTKSARDHPRMCGEHNVCATPSLS